MSHLDARAWSRAVGAGVVAAALVALTLVVGAPGVPARADDGSSSAVTVTAKDADPDDATSPAPDLAVTVSQTKDLMAQGIKVSWTGGKQSTLPSSSNGGTNFLQIAQCWGEDEDHPGHADRTTCQFGGVVAVGSGREGNPAGPDAVAAQDKPYTAAGSSVFDPDYTAIPFRAATGDVIAPVVDGKRDFSAPRLSNNAFYTQYTTNEVTWAGSSADGSGSVNFEVQTAQQAQGLGCGAPVDDTADAAGASCWLVVIPRGTSEPGSGVLGITSSPLFWDNWKHAISIKLDFRALGLHCQIGAAERDVSGSEVGATAVLSWQPAMCNVTDGAVYSLVTSTESDATAAAALSDDAPLALTSRALDKSRTDGTDPLTYAPVALAGVTIAFAVDRSPLSTASAADQAKAGQAFTNLKLTPRLLAKLLSYSYWLSLPQGADLSHIGFIDFAHPGPNPMNITYDPDFLKVNPDWDSSRVGVDGFGVSDILVPQGRSDAAAAVWSYIMSDADARAFLAGKPDPWGMKVNPYWSTDAKLNPTGEAIALPTDTFPKADPVEAPGTGGSPSVSLVTYRPYTNDLSQSASLTLRGDAQVLGSWDITAVPAKFGKQPRNLPGTQKVLGLTDTGDASRYQLYTAQLQNPAGEFVGPTTEGLIAAAAAAVPSAGQSQVRTFVPTSSEAKGATTAYPLTMPIYAAARSDLTDKGLRTDYADFIRYAVGDGQDPGTAEGMLPPGYAPLPQSWRDLALKAADAIGSGATATQPPTDGTSNPDGGAFGGGVPSADAPAGVGDVPASAGEPQPTASGTASTVFSGQRTAADKNLGPLPYVIPASGTAGAAALGVTLLASRRRLLR